MLDIARMRSLLIVGCRRAADRSADWQDKGELGFIGHAGLRPFSLASMSVPTVVESPAIGNRTVREYQSYAVCGVERADRNAEVGFSRNHERELPHSEMCLERGSGSGPEGAWPPTRFHSSGLAVPRMRASLTATDCPGPTRVPSRRQLLFPPDLPDPGRQRNRRRAPWWRTPFHPTRREGRRRPPRSGKLAVPVFLPCVTVIWSAPSAQRNLDNHLDAALIRIHKDDCRTTRSIGGF